MFFSCLVFFFFQKKKLVIIPCSAVFTIEIQFGLKLSINTLIVRLYTLERFKRGMNAVI